MWHSLTGPQIHLGTTVIYCPGPPPGALPLCCLDEQISHQGIAPIVDLVCIGKRAQSVASPSSTRSPHHPCGPCQNQFVVTVTHLSSTHFESHTCARTQSLQALLQITYCSFYLINTIEFPFPTNVG